MTKTDLLGPDATSPTLDAPDAAGVLAISSVAHQGLDTLKERLWDLLVQSEQHDPDDVPLP
jgi:hypothetical protein